MPAKSSPLLLALGDSITAGVGGSWNRGYPKHLHSLLMPHHAGLELVNWGIPGLTIARLNRALGKGEHLHDRLSRADWIVMTIGGNDILGSLPRRRLGSGREGELTFNLERRRRFARELGELLATLRRFHSGPIYLGDLYDPFPNSPFSACILNGFNKSVLEPLSARDPRLHLVRVSEVLAGRQAEALQYYKSGTMRDLKSWLKRPIHPNDRGHEWIARAFYEKMLASR